MEIPPTSLLNETGHSVVADVLSRIVQQATAKTVEKEVIEASVDVALSNEVNVVGPKQLLLSKEVDELTIEIDKIQGLLKMGGGK